jgi:Lon protease-like protein
MFSVLRGAAARSPTSIPLFPLKTVLFPGGLLPLKVFEQRYIEMTKQCLKDEKPFGVCLLKNGEEVARHGASVKAPDFATVGTLARIASCDVPQLGILHLRTEGGTRFQVQSHSVSASGLVVGMVTAIPAEPAAELAEGYRPLAALLEALIERVGREHFAAEPALGDASWVSYRLAELLPLPLSVKQSMLEINDSDIRLKVLAKFLDQQGLL